MFGLREASLLKAKSFALLIKISFKRFIFSEVLMPIVAAVGTITTMTGNLESLGNPPGTVARLRADTHRIRRNSINIHLIVKGLFNIL